MSPGSTSTSGFSVDLSDHEPVPRSHDRGRGKQEHRSSRDERDVRRHRVKYELCSMLSQTHTRVFVFCSEILMHYTCTVT